MRPGPLLKIRAQLTSADGGVQHREVEVRDGRPPERLTTFGVLAFTPEFLRARARNIFVSGIVERLYVLQRLEVRSVSDGRHLRVGRSTWRLGDPVALYIEAYR